MTQVTYEHSSDVFINDDQFWDESCKSCEVLLIGGNKRTALFHPNWSDGTAGVRALKPLSQFGITYWEIRISDRLFGTSLMFGVVTARARLQANTFVDLLGEDQHGWALSHKGHLFHNGVKIPYTHPFAENHPTAVGILYDGNKGTLSFFQDRQPLGIAFTGLDRVKEPLYPALSSTAARTEMTLISFHHPTLNLQDHCRSLILASTGCNIQRIDHLPLPRPLRSFLKEPLVETHQQGRGL